MKRIFICIMLASILLSSYFISPSQEVNAGSIADNSVIILSGKVNQQNELVIQANLAVNSGIAGMTLELSYDKTAMKLSNVVFGNALSSLNPITTNTQTEAGYAITPFKFNYWGEENDFTTGVLFTLTFELSNNVKDGNYVVSLKYAKDKDVLYYDNNVEKTKNLYIDRAEIEIKNNSVIQVITVESVKSDISIWLYTLLGVVIAVAVACIVIAVRYFVKKQRNWERI